MFSFSKKECESLALQMVSLDLTSEDEKKLVEGVFNSARDLLAESDARCTHTRSHVVICTIASMR